MRVRYVECAVIRSLIWHVRRTAVRGSSFIVPIFHTLGLSPTHRSVGCRSHMHTRWVLGRDRWCRAPRSDTRRQTMMQSSAAAFGGTLGCVRHEVRYRCLAVTSPSIRLLLRCHGSGSEAHGPWQLLRSSALASSCHGMSHRALPAARCARGVEACTAVN